jgi:uncharacterized membrane protein HdeD (DUF308 family)
VLGVITIVLSAVVLANPGLDILTLILILAGALLVVGLARILVGAFGKHISNGLRSINLGAGLLEIVITIMIMLYPQDITQTLIQLLSVALFVHGVNSAVIGGYARTLQSLLRGLLVVIGLLSIALSVTAFISIPIGFLSVVYILAIGYLLTGISEIIQGIAGTKRSRMTVNRTK